ncbi:hypothetical protein [Corynebacterium glutamicum]|uniref:hypothetical protein n=1 Tax=Corynebacterium glutamicum TaxID=1718 RepID=UPI000744B3D2|nr:hypothetical protein [Corynebacterium glutamicum]AMA00234.1 hypothetical protein APT58_08345 [Corynebacterium glutamicum]
MMGKKVPAFVGLDIETTGLDPHEGVILELGMVIFDHALQPLTARSWLLNDWEDHPGELEPVVIEMHEQSGLFLDLISAHHPPLSEVEAHARWWLRDNQAEHLPMLGSSITFDRTWLATHAPRLLDTFHYRSLDATSIKLAVLAQHHNSPHLTDITHWIDDRAGQHRDRFMEALDIPEGQKRPHRVIYDICGSAGLTIAALERNSSIETTEKEPHVNLRHEVEAMRADWEHKATRSASARDNSEHPAKAAHARHLKAHQHVIRRLNKILEADNG